MLENQMISITRCMHIINEIQQPQQDETSLVSYLEYATELPTLTRKPYE